MSDVPFLAIDDRDSTRYVTMENRGRRNAVPPAGWDELRAAFEAFETSDQRILVIRGAGEDFCAGADLVDFLEGDLPSAAENLEAMRRPSAAALALHRVSKPTVAAVDGVAVGAGMNLAIGCDMVVATDRARFSEIFVARGLTLDFGGTWLLPRLVGMAVARDLALTGRIVAADEALAIGLVGAVVRPDELDAAIEARVEALAAGAPLAQRFIKTGLDRSSTMTFEQSLAYETQSQAVLMASEDVREGIAAFLEKRPPVYRAR